MTEAIIVLILTAATSKALENSKDKEEILKEEILRYN